MTLLHATLLGIIQGLTEFLPISSSAHLILARAFFGWDAEFGLAFDVACHVGTLLAILVYFRRDLLEMVAGVSGIFRRPMPEPALRLWLVVVGTIPVVIAGLTVNSFVEATMRTPAVAAVTLVAGSLVMFAAERLGTRTRRDATLTTAEAFGLGWAQAAALVPGVSRSGATISLAMIFDLRREDAARFSFLLGVPAIIAAAGHEGLKAAKAGLGGDAAMLFAVGITSSALVGYVTVKYFLQLPRGTFPSTVRVVQACVGGVGARVADSADLGLSPRP